MNNEQQQEHQESMNVSAKIVTMFSSPLLAVTIIQDNAASLPYCMSKTMRGYLLQTFPDLATVPEETRWKSQPTSSEGAVGDAIMKKALPMAAPQRQDSFSLSCSSHSTGSVSSVSTTSSSFTPTPINRRKILVRQGSSCSLSHRDMSRLVRQTSLRGMGKPGAGFPRMPQRQDSVSFFFS